MTNFVNPRVEIFSINSQTKLKLPFIENGVKAGFPSPADDFLEHSIDLNIELIKNPAATYYGRVKGDSMKDLGIESGDFLIIDKSIPPQNGKIAVCYLDGEFTMKKIYFNKNLCWLMPANKNYRPIKVTQENDFVIWGIVTHVIKNF